MFETRFIITIKKVDSSLQAWAMFVAPFSGLLWTALIINSVTYGMTLFFWKNLTSTKRQTFLGYVNEGICNVWRVFSTAFGNRFEIDFATRYGRIFIFFVCLWGHIIFIAYKVRIVKKDQS
jgi:hypothetical protein